MTIIKLHGCSGAGKTTAVRQFMERATNVTELWHEFPREKGKPIRVPVYKLEHFGILEPTFVIGKYGDNWCGGVDTITDWRHAWQLVTQYAPQGHVIFEGLLQSTYYGSMGNLSREYDDEFVYAFLDTPVELCIERVYKRRQLAGSKTKFDPKNTMDKHDTIQRLQVKLIEEGYHRVVTIDHTKSMPQQLMDVLGAR